MSFGERLDVLRGLTSTDRRISWLTAGLSLACAAAEPQQARACAPAPRPGQFVEIAGEEAVIVFDEATKTQTFIRRATFESAATDFGFIVPTPARPELSEAPAEVFDALIETIAPPERWETKGFELVPFPLTCAPLLLTMRGAQAPKAGVPPVRVLEERRVAGYDAAVLEADDAGALAKWLADHGYDARPELAKWLEPYVEGKWKLTAFKIAKEGEVARIGTSAVRMKFAIAKPFFPYREPDDQRANAKLQRRLRIFLISGARMQGFLEHSPAGDRTWPGKLEYAAPIPTRAAKAVEHAAGHALPAGAWLGAWLDPSSPRPGTTELYFERAPDQVPHLPEPIIHYQPREIPIPVDILAILGLIWFVRRRRRRRLRT